MRRVLCWLGIAVLVFCAPEMPACGDKLLLLGRVLRSSAMVSRPAAILAYASPNSVVAGLMSDPQWAAALAKGKHHVRVVQNPQQLSGALRSEHYDLMLASMAD